MRNDVFERNSITAVKAKQAPALPSKLTHWNLATRNNRSGHGRKLGDLKVTVRVRHAFICVVLPVTYSRCCGVMSVFGQRDPLLARLGTFFDKTRHNGKLLRDRAEVQW